MTTILHFWWQILVAALVYFFLGAIWYNPKVLGTAWARSHGISMDPDKAKEFNMAKLFIMSFICSLILCTAVCLVCTISCDGISCNAAGGMGICHCLKAGLLIGGSAVAAISMGYIYLLKPLNAYLIDGGYNLTGCMIASVIFYLTGCC